MGEDIKRDPFEEYIRHVEPDKRKLGYAWYTAVGLQAVDGLKTSDYLKDTAQNNIEGKITISEAEKLIESYYETSNSKDTDRTKEADCVSARIAAILSDDAFTFSLPQYLGIHKRLFEGIYDHAGKIRDYNISKKEWVLDGASVPYGNALDLKATLEYDLQTEKEYEYSYDNIRDDIRHLSRFVANLWQIHAFGEGNTRTTAVFFIKYLRTMGFDVTNDIFAENAWYFRNALVRANYNDYSKGVHATTEYLESFMRNLLLGEHNELHNRNMHISGYFEKQDIEKAKQDIGDKKQDIEEQKQDIHIPEEIGNKTKNNIISLFKKYGYESFFGRSEVMETLSITASPASALIKRMLDMEIIYPMKGKGKGKYLFKK
ncbi:Fic family protein [Butyrivibrio sp. INlla16]|uniref:Fic family protein n=1 Tax=Butyrivibrio sp. INlla16 TaxID=1520807 RepID=UPI000891DFAC|nr:Fic family protein [Butyrivibrio sp. INlla16]SDB65084.1 Fic/DOC family protein [Butyrivibrio sp. INlla16]